MASETEPTDWQPAEVQKNSLVEKLKKYPGDCWKALTSCYKTSKIQPSSTTPGPNYRMPSSDLDEEESVTEQHDKLSDGQPPISPFTKHPLEEQPPQAEVRKITISMQIVMHRYTDLVMLLTLSLFV